MQVVAEQDPVRQIGQRVVIRNVFKLLLMGFVFGDIRRQCNVVLHNAVVV